MLYNKSCGSYSLFSLPSNFSELVRLYAMTVKYTVYGNIANENLQKSNPHGSGEITQALKWQSPVLSSQPCPLECFSIV